MNPYKPLRTVKKYIIDWFLPNRCPICKRLIPWDKLICADCSKKLFDISDKLCRICGKIKCQDHSQLEFDAACCVYCFDGAAKEGIYSLKYHHGFNFGELAAKKLAQILKRRDLAAQIDVVTCVPMSKQRLRKRRRNHSAIIAKALAAELDKPFYNKLLCHLHSDTIHHRLKAKQRKINASESFTVYEGHKDITGKTVLLCDDVYTTGATLNICSKLLRSMGAKKVIAACAATTLLDDELSQLSAAQ